MFRIEDSCLMRYDGSESNVEIPYGVTSIGYCAFHQCSNLEFIIVDNESEKQRVKDLVSGNLKGKLITQQAYDNYIKEKKFIILSVLIECLLPDNNSAITRFPPNVFISQVLPWLENNHIDSGKVELLRFQELRPTVLASRP